MNTKLILSLAILLGPALLLGQNFTRSVLPFPMDNPWEIVYGQDDYLWVSEKSGRVSRVNPVNGLKKTVFVATDYYSGDDSESAICGLHIGNNTYGLAMHPDFLDPESAFIYYIYSYNSGTNEVPKTLFKIVRLQWDAATGSITDTTDLVTDLTNGFDHFGYRMISVKQNGKNYLYYSIGDTGSNFDDCYETPADNPNNFAQDPNVLTGKIHRINIDGTIPDDNPIAGNSFFTRGHRNPQGLAYNPNMDVLYDIEHGHTTDDEVNVLEAGMNYGWKNVKGYHDGNYPDELDYVANYIPHQDVPNDRLVEPLFSWGVSGDTDGGFLEWPTVAPSDGIYYGSDGIPEWTNSLLVVTLKNGTVTDQVVFQMKLNSDGKSLVTSTPEDPNPKAFFAEDQDLNGRLRDIAISPDGRKIFLITNNNSGGNPIIVYTVDESSATTKLNHDQLSDVNTFPNPFSTEWNINFEIPKTGNVRIEISNIYGQMIKTLVNEKLEIGTHSAIWDGSADNGQILADGMYLYTLYFEKIRQSGKILMVK